MKQTIAEKILSNHSGKKVIPGEIVIADLDFCMGQDGTSGIIIDVFNQMSATKVFNKNKVAMVIDHSSPSPNEGVSAIHKKIRDFVEKTGIILYDVGCGVCHQLLPEQGHVTPGDLVIGADSHTCSYGAINVFSTGMGSTDVASGIISGKNWFRVPESIKFVVHGKLGKGVYSKDIILYLIGQVTADGATYKAVEYTGSAIDALSVEARFTIANMAIEMGAKCGIMEPDEKMIDWVKVHSKKKFKPVSADKDAQYLATYEYKAENIGPQVARPHAVDNVCPVEEVEGTPIQQGVIGTCTNGRLEDLTIAAKILKGKKIKSGTRLIVAPASKDILLDGMRTGVIKALVEAGASLVTPGCGPCVGTHNGVPSDGEKVISTANRNFLGRMGNNRAEIYLASPATVAVSMLYGKITDPRSEVK